jgi:hypothetical protein
MGVVKQSKSPRPVTTNTPSAHVTFSNSRALREAEPSQQAT